MGNQTTVMILNDAFHVIEQNPEEFIRGIKHNMHDGGSFPVGNHCNPATVVRTHHADDFQLSATYHNSIIDLSDAWRNGPESLAARVKENPYLREFVRTCIDRARYDLEALENMLDAIQE